MVMGVAARKARSESAKYASMARPAHLGRSSLERARQSPPARPARRARSTRFPASCAPARERKATPKAPYPARSMATRLTRRAAAKGRERLSEGPGRAARSPVLGLGEEALEEPAPRGAGGKLLDSHARAARGAPRAVGAGHAVRAGLLLEDVHLAGGALRSQERAQVGHGPGVCRIGDMNRWSESVAGGDTGGAGYEGKASRRRRGPWGRPQVRSTISMFTESGTWMRMSWRRARSSASMSMRRLWMRISQWSHVSEPLPLGALRT